MGQCSKIHLKPRVFGIIFWNLSPVTGVLDLVKLVFGVKNKKKKKKKKKKSKSPELSNTLIKSTLTPAYLGNMGHRVGFKRINFKVIF